MSSIINPLIGNTQNGLSFQATPATLQQPTTAAQAGQAYTNSQAGLDQQQSFLNAVNAQNGLGNQSQVFNQLQGVANGTGPNPAQAALNQNTAANVSNQAALMAGQRGSSANTGLIARQAAQQGAATQQQAVGQGATLQANQSLNAINSAGTIANNQAANQAAATNAYSSAAQGEQGTLLNSINAQNQANVANQSNLNTVNANMAGTVAGGQQNLLSNLTSSVGSVGSLFGGSAAATPTTTAGYTMPTLGSSATAAAPAYGLGSDATAAPAAGGNIFGVATDFAEGGKVPKKMADGGNTNNNPAYVPQSQPVQPMQVAPQYTPPSVEDQGAPQSNVGQYMAQNSAPAAGKAATASPLAGIGSLAGAGMSAAQGLTKQGGALDNLYNGASNVWDSIGGYFSSGAAGDTLMAGGAEAAPVIGEGAEAATAVAAKGGRAHKDVPALVSPGEKYVKPNEVKAVASGKKDPLKTETIPGKPKYPGNNYANDVIPKKLKEGGIIIPNAVLQGPNPHWAAHKFVLAHMAKGGLVKSPKKAK